MSDLFDAPTLISQGAVRKRDHSVQWCVWAPFCEYVNLVTWPAGHRTTKPMEVVGNGHYVLRMAEAEERLRYAFELPDGGVRPDPASRWQPDGIHEPSALFFPETFLWTDQAWKGVPDRELSLYELHVGTFTPEGTLDAILPRLPQLADLGVTAIELMPVAQFPGTRNWGYDGVHPFAVQNSYGGPRALQRLVDAAHSRGLAVHLDVVYNHLGPEGNYFAQFGPYFADHHHTPWGRAINYDGGQSDAVRRYVIDNACYWVRELHLDGLRLDAVQTIHDAGAHPILAELQEAVQQIAQHQDRHVQVIAETNQNDARQIRSKKQGGYALDGVWADDLHHATHALLTGENDAYYIDFGQPGHVAKALTEAFVFDGRYSRYRRRRHGSSTRGIDRTKFVVCLQNHDQVGNRPHSERIATLLPPAAQRLAASLLLTSPFTPLLFMGEEYAETCPFPFFCSFLDRGLHDAVRSGRREGLMATGFNVDGDVPDPLSEETFLSAKLSWDWPVDSPSFGLRRLYQDLLAARKTWPHLRTRAHAHATMSASAPILIVQYPSEPTFQIHANLTATPHLAEKETIQEFTFLFSSEAARYCGARQDTDAQETLLAYELQVRMKSDSGTCHQAHP
ncbi:MAG: malto-oligosyltrehalose trehalohydrolase [Pirellulales bacterium]